MLLTVPCPRVRQQWAPAFRTHDHLESPSSCPPLFQLYALPNHNRDHAKMGDEESGEYSYIAAIPGVSEDRGEQLTVVFTVSGFWRLDQMSVHAGLWRQSPVTDAPPAVEESLREVSASPPSSGPRRVPRSLGHHYRAGYAPLLCQLRACPLAGSHPELCTSLESVVTYAFHFSDMQAVRPVTPATTERL